MTCPRCSSPLRPDVRQGVALHHCTCGNVAAPRLARLLDGLASLGAAGAMRNAGRQLAAERDAVAAAESRLASLRPAGGEHPRLARPGPLRAA